MLGKKIIFALVILSLGCTINASDNQFFFRSLDSKDGLSENRINSIYQDKKGFIWIGTDGGLNRYDGHDFKTYYLDPEVETGLRSNIIQCITEDQDGVDTSYPLGHF